MLALSFAHNFFRQMERQTETHTVHTPTHSQATSLVLFHTGAEVIEQCLCTVWYCVGKSYLCVHNVLNYVTLISFLILMWLLSQQRYSYRKEMDMNLLERQKRTDVEYLTTYPVWPTDGAR